MLEPSITAREIATQALKESGAFGLGQSPLDENIRDALLRLQWMLNEWSLQRGHVVHLRTLHRVSSARTSYSVGPGGHFDTGKVQRPGAINSAYLRRMFLPQVQGNLDETGALLPNQGGIGAFTIGETAIGPGEAEPTAGGPVVIPSGIREVDFPITILRSLEEYNQVPLKQLVSQSVMAYYDPAWPLGFLYTYPVAPANLYEIHISFLAPLPTEWIWADGQSVQLPTEYYQAMVSNLALRLRPVFRVATFPGDTLPLMARNSRLAIEGNTRQHPLLRMPPEVSGRGAYDIFSDNA